MKKHLLYAKYLFRHKWFVFVAGRKLGVNWFRLLVHDWSKFLPSEWFPYANYFYAKYPKWMDVSPGLKGAGYPYELTSDYWEDRFNFAWNLHQKRNRHHYQFWILVNDDGTPVPLEMSRKYELEMLADWAGAGRAITGKWGVKEWYEKTKEQKFIHHRTSNYIEKNIDTLEKLLNV